MTLSFKPHVLALIGSAGILAASGALYVHSRASEPPAQPAPVVQPAAPAPTTTAAPMAATPVAPTFSSAQIDQLVAPVALYPDALLSQVLMASTYPSNVLQAVQWSQDNPNMQGDPAVQAVASQPWDPSVKSLVAFPALLSLMGENPQWVQDLGNAFLAQPQDVMNSVQKLRNIALQTGTLQTTPQQKVTTTTKVVPATTGTSTTTSATTSTTPASTQIVTIESADPNVVYVPTYNPSTAYGTWPNSAYPPVYLPPPPGEQFGDSFMRGLGFSLGVATTYAIFSDIDWDDDDDYHHHNGDWDGGYARNGNNIKIDVNNFNRVTGEHLTGDNVRWQHNPNYRSNVPYPNSNVTQRFNQTAAAGGLSATQSTAANRTAQRQAAATQFQERTGTAVNTTAAAGTRDAQRQAAARSNTQRQPASRDAQRQAASKQLNQVTQRNNYRGYDSSQATTAKKQRQTTPAQQQQRRESAKTQIQQPSAQQQQRRQQTQTPERRQQQVQTARANALSGNDSRSPSWEAQRQRGIQSRSLSSGNQRPAARGNASQHREMRQR